MKALVRQWPRNEAGEFVYGDPRLFVGWVVSDWHRIVGFWFSWMAARLPHLPSPAVICAPKVRDRLLQAWIVSRPMYERRLRDEPPEAVS